MSRIIFLQCGCSHYYAILWLCKRIHCVKIGLHFCIIQSAFFFVWYEREVKLEVWREKKWTCEIEKTKCNLCTTVILSWGERLNDIANSECFCHCFYFCLKQRATPAVSFYAVWNWWKSMKNCVLFCNFYVWMNMEKI